MPSRRTLVAGVLPLCLLYAPGARAQAPNVTDVRREAAPSRIGYVTANGFTADFRTRSIDGRAATGGLSVGLFLTPRVAVEAEVTTGAALPPRRFAGGGIVAGAVNASTPREVLERFMAIGYQEDRVELGRTVSMSVGYHLVDRGRVRPVVRAGLSFRRLHSSQLGSYPIVAPDLVNYEVVSYAQSSSRRQTHLLAGIDIPVEVWRRLAIVPQIGIEVGNYGDHVEGVIRPGIGLRWGF